jgi:hypothetical protein
MDRLEAGDGFQLNNNLFLDEQIQPVLPNDMLFVSDRHQQLR